MQLPLDWFVLLASATLPLMQQIRRALILALVTVCFGFSAEDAQPPVVDPGGQGKTPSDAIVLFDGRNLKEWVHQDGTPAKWAVEDGAMVCKTGTGNIHSKRTFSSDQIHIEFAMPYQAEAKGQARTAVSMCRGAMKCSCSTPTGTQLTRMGQPARSMANPRPWSTPAGHPGSGRATTSSSMRRSVMAIRSSNRQR